MYTDLQLRISQARKSAKENNINSDELVKLLDDCLNQMPSPSIIHEILDFSHINTVSKIIYKSNNQDIWLHKIIQLIKISNYNFGILLKQRALHNIMNL